MEYNVTLFTTVAECDTVLNMLNKQRRKLENRKDALEIQQEESSGTSIEVEAELLSISSQIAAIESYIATLPEGAIKEKSVIDKYRLELRRKILIKQRGSYGAIAQLDKVFDINCIDHELDEIDAYIAATTNRKNEL